MSKQGCSTLFVPADKQASKGPTHQLLLGVDEEVRRFKDRQTDRKERNCLSHSNCSSGSTREDSALQLTCRAAEPVRPGRRHLARHRRRGHDPHVEAWSRQMARKGTDLDRKAVEAQQKDSALVLTEAEAGRRRRHAGELLQVGPARQVVLPEPVHL
eukprot:SAG22_NODE_977_length_6195_cov_6.522060_4_plen_157_part_00